MRKKLEKDFEQHFQNYVLTCEEIDWKSVDGVEIPQHHPMIWKDLWKANMGHVMKVYFFSNDKGGGKYGFLPKMAIASRGSIGALMAASFCERINSYSNLVVTEGNSVLGPELVEKVVMLRMNQGFIEMMRREYPEALALKYPEVGTIVSPQDNAEDTQPSEKAPLRHGIKVCFTFHFYFSLMKALPPSFTLGRLWVQRATAYFPLSLHCGLWTVATATTVSQDFG